MVTYTYWPLSSIPSRIRIYYVNDDHVITMISLVILSIISTHQYLDIDTTSSMIFLLPQYVRDISKSNTWKLTDIYLYYEDMVIALIGFIIDTTVLSTYFEDAWKTVQVLESLYLILRSKVYE